MKTIKTPLESVGAFSSLFLDYLAQSEKLASFYNVKPEINAFKKLIEERAFPSENRLVLHEVLNEQYAALEKSEALFGNIYSLQHDHTFTVTTGHQLNIFTGPLYFIFKIATTINLAKKLNEAYPDQHFVPVYWMATEDHDFEEINHFHLFGKKYVWETQQKGAVGRFAPHSLNQVIEQLPEQVNLFEKAYLDASTLSEAVRMYVNELFGEQGLLVIDADHPRLKKVFAPYIKKEIVAQPSNQLVEETSNRLQQLGYKSQAFSREINFFFLNGFRDRIVKEGDRFKVLNHEETYDQESLESLIEEKPQHFSPNVITRPLYQEVVLPNLAYIGGPAEVAYWLQLKPVFDHYKIPFPVLMPRNFGMVINKGLIKKIEKVGLSPEKLYQDAHTLKSQYLEKHSDNEHHLSAEKERITSVFDAIKEKAGSIDKSMEGFIASEHAKAQKALENMEKRLKKAQEKQNDTAMSQIDSIKEKLFPNGGLQERHDNFLNFYLNNPDFLQQLLDAFDPFDFSFYQFWEH
jgi:bacillithiol biosynthesis cysteine-adding enzyme BshC